MRVACIFCGHVRSWSKCRDSIIGHVIKPTGAMVGAASYSMVGYNVHDGKGWSDPASSLLREFSTDTSCLALDVSDELQGDVAWASSCPQACSWASRQDRLKVPDLRLPGVKTAKSLQGAVGMFGCWKRGVDVLHRMEREVGSFTHVIRMRFDLSFLSTPDWSSIFAAVDDGAFVSPDFCNFKAKGGCNDQMFIAPRDLWVEAMSIHDRLEEYCRRDGVELHPETIFGHHLSKIGARMSRHHIDFVIRRTCGGVHDLRKAKG